MKKLKLLLPLFLAGLFIVSCGEKPNDNGHDTETIPEPVHIISVEQAELLYSDYTENRVDLIENAQNVDENGKPIPEDDPRYIPATRALYVDYKELKKYLKYIDQQAGAADVNVKNLRIYIGKYPDDSTPEEIGGKRPGSETVFLNPTTQFDFGEASFATQIGPKGDTIAVSVGSVLGKTKISGVGNLLFIQDGNVQSLAFDDLGQIPPPHSDKNDY